MSSETSAEDLRERLRKNRLRAVFAAWERKQGVHRELERYAAKINRRILGRFFGYWGNLHDAYAKVSGVSDGMRNRKIFEVD